MEISVDLLSTSPSKKYPAIAAMKGIAANINNVTAAVVIVMEKIKPINFLEVGIFHGVTSRNVCELLYIIHGENFKFTGIDLFSSEESKLSDEIAPKTKFSNPLKTIYYNYLQKSDPYSYESEIRLLSKVSDNVNIIKRDSNQILRRIRPLLFDYVFLIANILTSRYSW